jgi:L-fuculose-phosphate aldolase
MTTTESQWELREKIIELCLWMNSSGLNQGTSGNISARYKNSMLITPSGVPYEQLKPTDIAKMSLKHNLYEWKGPFAPSSEWHFHRAILQSNPGFKAVVHTHSTYGGQNNTCVSLHDWCLWWQYGSMFELRYVRYTRIVNKHS